MKLLLSSLLSILFLFSCDQQLNQVVKTYENGQKWSEGNFNDGMVDGSFTFWYENGQKSYEENYRDGIRVGKWIGWYENGKKSSEKNYKNNRISIETLKNLEKFSFIFLFLSKIKKIAKKHKIFLIEDTAWGCGGKYKGVPLGNIGDIGTFSFDFAKTMTTGEGGMVIFKNKKLLFDIASVLAMVGVLLNIFLFIRSISIFKYGNTMMSKTSANFFSVPSA